LFLDGTPLAFTTVRPDAAPSAFPINIIRALTQSRRPHRVSTAAGIPRRRFSFWTRAVDFAGVGAYPQGRSRQPASARFRKIKPATF
jgi:hypothetical protein